MGRPYREIDTDLDRFLKRPGIKVLDLCCCSGVGIEGIISDRVHVLGVDIKKPSYYPGTFLQADVTKLPLTFVQLFNFAGSSPPCQIHSRGTIAAQNRGKVYIDIIPEVRALLTAAGIPAYIENIPEAGIRPDFMLCGSMFGLPILRHRYFEAVNWSPSYSRLYCDHAGNKGNNHVIAGSFRGSIHDAAVSMGCYPTRLRSELKEGIPPVYVQFIFNTWLNNKPAI